MNPTPTLMLFAAAAALPAQSLDELVARIAAAATYDEEYVSDEPSAVFADFRRLCATASRTQLLRLCEHDAPAVRCYAVRALVAAEAKEQLPAILAQHSRDVAEVEARSGCIRYTAKTGDLMFEAAKDRLGDEQLRDLGEHYVRTDSPLYAREWSLRNLQWREGMHPVLHRMAADGTAPALIALARFGDPEDVPVLAAGLRQPAPFDDNCAFLAAELSRDPRLLEPLTDLRAAAQERLRRDVPLRLRFWLRAIAAQATPAAADFLVRFLDDRHAESPAGRERLREVVREAAAAHPSPAMERVVARTTAADRK